ncbi:hypothetical protein ACU4HD_48255 [Cupriavidus basilensis]
MGVHARVSAIVARGQRGCRCTSTSPGASGSGCAVPGGSAQPDCDPRCCGGIPLLLTQAKSFQTVIPRLQTAVARRRALDMGVQVAPDDVIVTHGCIEGGEPGIACAVAQPGDTVAVESAELTARAAAGAGSAWACARRKFLPAHAPSMSLEALEMAVRACGTASAPWWWCPTCEHPARQHHAGRGQAPDGRLLRRQPHRAPLKT